MTPPIAAAGNATTPLDFRAGPQGKPVKPSPTTPTPTDPATTEPAGLADLLTRRATWGPTPQLRAQLATEGAAAWLEKQLTPAGLADPDGDAVTGLFPQLAYGISVAHDKYADFDGDLLYATISNTVGRAIWSSRQLHEVMTAFWNDHLHILGMFWDAWDSRHRYDLDVIRPHALGKFATMLQASTRHPAMQRYLDQNNSRSTALNENLGRELLELHTVGVGNHTEADVLASARMLTGISIGVNHEYLYRSDFHHVGSLTIAGRTFTNASANGEAALTEYLDHLARHPRTAERIARKLVVRFVSDTPSEALISRLTTIYLANDTDIVPVLRALFLSAEFAASAGQKLRTPQEDVFAMVRVLGFGRPTSPVELKELHWALTTAGHGPMDWAPPNGFPDTPAHWATPSVALARLNLHMNITGNWWPKFTGYPTSVSGRAPLLSLLDAALPATHGDFVQALATRLLSTRLDAATLQAVLTYLGVDATRPLTATSAAASWRLPYLVALLFDTPAHAIR